MLLQRRGGEFFTVQPIPVSMRFSVEPRRSLNKSSVIITNYE